MLFPSAPFGSYTDATRDPYGCHSGAIGSYHGPPMMLTVDRDALEELLRHAASAARLAGSSDALADGLADHVDAITHALGEILGEPRPVAPLSERVDWLRHLVARADALATALGEMFDGD